MSCQPYTMIDFTRTCGGFPLVTHGCRHYPTYRAEKIDHGTDVFLEGVKVAWFATMEDACAYITSKRDD